MSYDTKDKPTLATYEALQAAYDWFNRELFSSELPQALIVLHRKRNARGYFWADQWHSKADSASADGSDNESDTLDEISLTPETLDRPDKEILSTLVHEMCHLKQHHFGKPSRSGYHNKEWAEMMLEVGLHPTTNGQWDGKQTGQRCTHLIIEGGSFDTSASAFLEDRSCINYFGLATQKKASKKNKTVYECNCGNKVWAKPGLNIVCGDCEETYQERG